MNSETIKLADQIIPQSVRITAGPVSLEGELSLPPRTKGIVLFAHGSGSSRHSPRNQFVAQALQNSGTGTLLFDLLTREEEASDAVDGHLRFDIGLLARRLVAATGWLARQRETAHLGLGYFGASTGGAAALVAAAELGAVIDAVVSREGRPDLAGESLAAVEAPTLLIVGQRDTVVHQLNRQALNKLTCPKQLVLVPNATHLFEQPGALEEVATLAADWFKRYLHPR